MNEFFEMGGYAAFVWPAWGLTAAVLLGLLAMSMAEARARKSELALLEATVTPRRRRRKSGETQETERTGDL